MSVPERDIPFTIHQGWPEALSDGVVTASEAGIALGSLILSESDWMLLRTSVVFALRIDEHREATHGWTTTYPDGTVSSSEFAVPTSPVVVPPAVLNGGDFPDWVLNTHGSLGRLLVWDQSHRWWLVNDPDLEAQIICAPTGTFVADLDPDEPFSWLPALTPVGREHVAHVRRLYQLN